MYIPTRQKKFLFHNKENVEKNSSSSLEICACFGAFTLKQCFGVVRHTQNGGIFEKNI